MHDDATSVESHFAFGENWARLARQFDAGRVRDAETCMLRLVGRNSLQGLSFLDIGSGSGLHSLAAVHLCCARLLAIDIDPVSVETTRSTLTALAGEAPWECRELSVFDLETAGIGVFDVVYAWGVLHHSGDMYRAIAAAARHVAPGGLAVFALYRKTPLCRLWRGEKYWYSRAPAWAQRLARGVYIAVHWTSLIVRGRSIQRFIRTYPQRNRGMDYYHDVHDWMGGYPYESISAAEIERYLHDLGLTLVRSFTHAGRLGLLGSGNDEYVFRRIGTAAAPE